MATLLGRTVPAQDLGLIGHTTTQAAAAFLERTQRGRSNNHVKTNGNTSLRHSYSRGRHNSGNNGSWHNKAKRENNLGVRIREECENKKEAISEAPEDSLSMRKNNACLQLKSQSLQQLNSDTLDGPPLLPLALSKSKQLTQQQVIQQLQQQQQLQGRSNSLRSKYRLEQKNGLLVREFYSV